MNKMIVSTALPCALW